LFLSADDPELEWTREVLGRVEAFIVQSGFQVEKIMPRLHLYHLEDDPDLRSCDVLVKAVAGVDTKNPDRGPLLIIDGEKDHTVPWAIANAAYKRQKRNPGVTEIVKIPNRGHSLTIDHGWREVAETALNFVKRFA